MINVVFKMNYWDFKFNHLTANEAAKTKNEGMYVCVCVWPARNVLNHLAKRLVVQIFSKDHICSISYSKRR